MELTVLEMHTLALALSAKIQEHHENDNDREYYEHLLDRLTAFEKRMVGNRICDDVVVMREVVH